MELIERFISTLQKEELTARGGTVIIGLSGGPDSVCLLNLFTRIKEEWQLRMITAHLNHGLRGMAADEDESFCKEMVRLAGIEFNSRKIDIAGYAASHKLSLEEAGRLARYRYFLELAEAEGANAVAVAHHADDWAETVLMRLLRGAGPDGLTGMTYRRPLAFEGEPLPQVTVEVIRPLLNISRKEIMEYLAERNISSRTDASNTNTVYLRNRIRHQLIPMLEKEYNPNIRETLCRTAEIITREEEYWIQLLDDVLEENPPEKREDGAILYPRQALNQMHLALRRRLIRKLIELAQGHLKGLGFDAVEDILKLAKKETAPSALDLPGELRVERDASYLVFLAKTIPMPSGSVSYELPLTSNLHANYFKMNFQVETLEATPELLETILAGQVSKAEVYLDFEKLSLPLHLRGWQEGDKMLPLGMQGHIKLHDIFINRKIPKWKRHLIPILHDTDHILWLTGIIPSDEAKVTQNTKQLLHISIEEKIV
jgi:tRNA(Ile)-lysidine synthase